MKTAPPVSRDLPFVHPRLARMLPRSGLGERARGGMWAACALLAVVWPLVNPSSYWLNVGSIVLTFVLLALGLHVIFGLAGLPFVGYAGLFGVGAYVAALVNTHWHLDIDWAILLAPLATSALSFVLALLFIRLKDVYFMIVSLAVGELVTIVAAAWAFTGGPNGLYGIQALHIAGQDLVDLKSLYFLNLGCVLASIAGLALFGRSRVGVSWLAVGRDENAAEALGIRTKRVKICALTLGGVWAGLAGTLYAAQLTAISPDAFTVYDSILLASAVLIGGRGSLGGTVLGAVALYALPEIFRGVAEYRLLVFGVAIMIILKARPEGLVPRRSRRFEGAAESKTGENLAA